MSDETDDAITLWRQMDEAARRSQERSWNAHDKDMELLWKIIRNQSTYIEQMRQQYEYALRFVGFATLVSLAVVLWKFIL